MLKEIKQLYLSIEQEEEEELDYNKSHTDVIVIMENGEKFAASFFSYRNIEVLKAENEANEEFLKGLFFWAPNMLLIEDCKRQTVEMVVQYLLEEGDFENVFKKI